MLDMHEYVRWINSAKRTLRSAYGDLERGDYNWSCFKAQQSAGMAIKALLRGLGLPSYRHSISRLLVDIKTQGINVPDEIIKCAKTLDKHYIPTRYPDAWSEGIPYEYYTSDDAKLAINYAEKIIAWVEEQWKSLRKELNSGKK